MFISDDLVMRDRDYKAKYNVAVCRIVFLVV